MPETSPARRRNAKLPSAYGVRVRHSRRCRDDQGSRCPCGPSFEAWVYDSLRQTKIRETFRTEREAVLWRVQTIRRLYKVPSASGSRALDKAYALLRRAELEVEGAPNARVARDAILASLYEAEDRLLRELTSRP